MADQPALFGASKLLTPQQIFKMAERRRSMKMFTDRNAFYEICLKYYHGDQGRSGVQRGIRAMDAKGKPLLRDLGSSMRMERALVANRMKPVVDDYQGVLGRWPRTRVVPPNSTENAGTAADKARKLTRYQHSTWDLARMDLQQAQAGFHLSSMGDTVYGLEVDWGRKRVFPVVLDPRMCFPAWMAGWRQHEIADMVVCYEMDPDSLRREFSLDLDDPDDGETYSVYTYISTRQRTVVVAAGKAGLLGGPGSLLPHVEWTHVETDPKNGDKRVVAGFAGDWCPVEWVHNLINENHAMGTSDIGPVLELQDLYNFTVNVTADGLVEMTYPMRGVINPSRFNADQIAIGPGEVVVLEEGGDILVKAPTPPPQAGTMLLHQTLEDMMAASGSSVVRQTGEQPHSSIATGRSLHAAQGPQATRIDLRQAQLGIAVMALASKMMAMQETAPELDKWMQETGIEINGRSEGRSFREQLLAIDFDGWYDTTVSFDQLVGSNAQSRLFVAGQGKAAGLYDDVTAMEHMGVEDPLGTIEKIREDKIRAAHVEAEVQKIMMSAQQGAPGAGPGPGGPGAPGGQPPGAGGPSGQAAPPGGPALPQPSLPFRPSSPGGLPPLPGGLPQGATTGAVKQALETADVDLMGTVWAIGELALKGVSTRPQLRISDYRDFRAVTAALAEVAPNSEVKAMPEDKLPDLKVQVG